MGKGENAGFQHFLLYPKCFQSGHIFRVVKSRDPAGKELTVYKLTHHKKVLVLTASTQHKFSNIKNFTIPYQTTKF